MKAVNAGSATASRVRELKKGVEIIQLRGAARQAGTQMSKERAHASWGRGL